MYVQLALHWGGLFRFTKSSHNITTHNRSRYIKYHFSVIQNFKFLLFPNRPLPTNSLKTFMRNLDFWKRIKYTYINIEINVIIHYFNGRLALFMIIQSLHSGFIGSRRLRFSFRTNIDSNSSGKCAFDNLHIHVPCRQHRWVTMRKFC